MPWLIPLNVLPILLLSHTTDIASTFVTKIYALDLQMNNHPYKLNFNSLRR
ncbi:Ornithine carbamoyltransferase 1 [Escherichia coli P12b]|nr:Ornithine carbamoyltransferase 1 [Escherichia coli P12b]